MLSFREEELEEDSNEAEKKQGDNWSYTKILPPVHCLSMDTGITCEDIFLKFSF